MGNMDGYCRVSAVMGRGGDGYMSPAIQEGEIRRWAREHSISVSKIVVEEDVSGGKAIRERGLEELVARVEQGRSDGVIVRTLDRFGRDSLDGAVAIKRLSDAGARLIAVVDGVDTGPGGSSKIALAVQLAIAEDYLDRVKRNWDDAKRRNLEVRGLHVCGRAPYGYWRKDEAEPTHEDGELVRNAKLIVNPDEAKVVRTVFEMRAEGQPFANIHRIVGLSPNAPTRIVKNRAYLGEARATVNRKDGRGTEVITKRDAHEAVVTPELFAAAQREPRLPNDGSLADKVLLSGLVRCATCDGRMHVRGRGPRGKRQAFYSCSNPDCEARAAIVAEPLDEYVVWLLANDTGSAEEAAGSEERRWLEARERVREREAELAELVRERGDLSLDAWRQMVVSAEAALEAARVALYDLPDPELDDGEAVVWLDGKPSLYALWGKDRDRDRRTLQRYIGTVTVAPCGRGRTKPVEARCTVRWKDGSEPVIAA